MNETPPGCTDRVGRTPDPACRRGNGRHLLPLIALAALASVPHAAWSACKLQKHEIPVRMVGSRPVATVSLDGTEVPMLVDSGAFFSMLAESTAAQLNLRTRRLSELRIRGYTGPVEARITRVNKVRLNGTEVSNIEFIVGGNELGAGIMGVLGRNFLSVADTEYDLAHGVVRLMFPQGDCENVSFAYWAGEAPVNVVPLAPASRGDTAIRVAARINGVTVDAMMDTGASQTSVKLRAARRAGIKDEEMVPAGHVGGAGSGRVRSWVAPLALFELGGEKVTQGRVRVDDADYTDDDMLLGADYFLSHRIYVSRLQSKVYATWNGVAVFAQNKLGANDDARYAAVPEPVAPDDADALARRGEAAAARHDFAQALDDLNRACVLAPQTARYFVSRARVHAAMRQPAKSLADLDEALRLDATLHDARADRAALRTGKHDRDGALADLHALDAALPPASHLRAGMASLYARLNLAPEALRQWDLWMPTHRNDEGVDSVLNNRCWLRARLNLDLPQALNDCKEAVGMRRDDPAFHDSLGWTHLRLDQAARAIEAFDRAIALRPASPWSYYGRGLAHRRLRNPQAAERDLSAARGLRPRIDDEVKTAGFDADEMPVAVPRAASAAGS